MGIVIFSLHFYHRPPAFDDDVVVVVNAAMTAGIFVAGEEEEEEGITFIIDVIYGWAYPQYSKHLTI